MTDSSAGAIREWSSGLCSIEPVRCRPWAEGEALEERVTVSSETRSSTMLSRSKACVWITFYVHVWWRVRVGGAQNAKDGKFGKFGLSPSVPVQIWTHGSPERAVVPPPRSDWVRTLFLFFFFFYSGGNGPNQSVGAGPTCEDMTAGPAAHTAASR